MAVTNPLRTSLLLSAMAVLLLGYQNCSVALSGSTPGASTFSCTPTDAQLLAFEPIETSPLTAVNDCGSCHLAGGMGKGAFLMTANPTSDLAIRLANYCTVANKGRTRMRVIFDGGHAGGTFSESSYSALASYLNAL